MLPIYFRHKAMENFMQPTIAELRNFFDLSLVEDLGIGGDITSDAVIRGQKNIDFTIKLRTPAVLCGLIVSDYLLKNYSTIKYRNHLCDKDCGSIGSVIISGTGDAHEILRLERVVLNYLQHLSAVATLTQQYVQEVSGTQTRICDTRKTIPGMRILQKYAVRCGGGYNHRYTLDSGILIKDNHISICGGIIHAVQNARLHGPHWSKIEVECDTLDQVEEALSATADIIMLDNMDFDHLKQAIAMIGTKAKIEVSGGVNLKNVREIANLGVHYISIGRLTHSAPAIDIGLDI
jgi:nicotinate-nucleotide pyrophosphorylase (carboxylating)